MGGSVRVWSLGWGGWDGVGRVGLGRVGVG